MALKEYDVEINGHRTTLQLSDEDAKRQGLFVEPEASAPAKAPAKAPANRAAPKPANKADAKADG